MKALTMPEIDALLSVSGLQLRAMVTFAFRHGARASEVTGLLRKDIDLESRTVTVRRLKHSLTQSQPLGRDEALLLRDWLSIAPKSVYAFPGRNGQRLARLTFYRWFREAALFVGVPPDRAHPHCLKHALAYCLVEANVSLPIIQNALGHRSLQSTAVYAKPSESIVNKIVSAVLDR